jgi:hypothetical protein
MVKIYNLLDSSFEIQKLKNQFTDLEKILHKNNIPIKIYNKENKKISSQNIMSYLSDSSIEVNNNEKINIFYKELQEKEYNEKEVQEEHKEEEEEEQEKDEEEKEYEIELLEINKYKINFLIINIKDKIDKIDDNLSRLYYNYNFCNLFKYYENYIKRKNFEKEKLIEIEKKKYLLFLLKNIEKLLFLHNNNN